MIRFSVIIPTFNRPDRLVTCLQSFLDLDYPADVWELIVVNDGGNQSFSAITNDLLNRLPLTLIDIEHGGPAKARNAGVKASEGEFIVFTDDDCRVDKNWLNAFEEGFKKSSSAALGGKILNPYPESIPAETWSQYMDYLREEVMRDTDNNLLLLISNNLAYRRSVFEKIGGFNETFPFAAAEDSELGYRLVGLGYQQIYIPEARIWHDHKNTCLGYLRQQFRYGQGNYYFQKILNTTNEYLVVRHTKHNFFSSMRNLFRFAEKNHAALAMKALFFATPFAFKLGNIYEIIWARWIAPPANLDRSNHKNQS